MSKKVISLFSGAGGMDLGFKNAGFEIIWSNEIDKYAVRTYKENFSHKIIEKDISLISLDNVPKSDLVIGGFPCQPFSVAGYRKGFEDKRGGLFWQIIKIVNKAKPKIIVLENVKNLLSHDNGNTYNVIEDTLKRKGYYVKHKIISSYEFNIPQTRQRIFIIAFKNKKDYTKFKWPKGIKLTKQISDMLIPIKKDEIYSYNNSKYYKLLKKEGKESVLQIRRHYIRSNKSKMFPTLTANMGTGGHNIPIIFDKKHKLYRRITPREAFNIQGFPKSFIFPKNMSATRLYKQAGNAVTVNVAYAVANSIMEVLSE